MPIPVLSAVRMRQWEEASWAAGRSQAEVIQQAGARLAGEALRLTRAGDRILILAGKGHNGDDARCAPPHLTNRTVEVLNVQNPTVDLASLESLLQQRPDLIIDGLFGIGLSRPLDGAWTRFVERINTSGGPVLAVDLPSGLNADKGEPQPVAVRAQVTLTFGAPKSGLVAPGAVAWVGKLRVAPEIGLIPCPFTEELRWIERVDFQGYPPSRPADGHKGSFGHVVILAGSQGYHGAAVMAARGALRAQPGLVTVVCHRLVYVPVASQLQAAMVHPFQMPLRLPSTGSALVIGPGLASSKLGPAWKEFTREVWRTSPRPMVVDASGLEWIETGPCPSEAVRVITPHPGEAARLLGSSAQKVQQDRVAATQELSKRYGDCWVVLKGHQTLIGRHTGPLFINSSGNPYLGQGGSGDVLAGFLGGILAQRSLQADPLKAILYAVWAHGAAADLLTERRKVWTIEDLLQTVGDY